MLWILIPVTLIALSYFLLIRPYKYWTERGVEDGHPVPIFGHNLGMALHTQSFADMVQMVYNISPNSRYCGMYQFLVPTLVLRDPDLIKQIGVKDFDYFLNHRSFIPEDVDPLWSKNLSSLTDQKWRDMRSTLSPAFTSSKMQFMFILILENAEQFVDYFLKQKEKVVKIEMKDTVTRFTNDVIANTAFGVKCNSLQERNNEFYLMGKEATNFKGFWKNFKIIGFFLFPQIFKFFRVQFFAKTVGDFFTKLVKENIESREKHGIVRPDMIHLLLEARKNNLQYEELQNTVDTGFATVQESEITKNAPTTKQKITDEDITAQALIFFFGGFDSVSSLMCFMSYELAINPDVQEKLRQEVDKTLENCIGKMTYEALMNMKYMDMVTSETLRLWPTGVAVDRVCNKDYTIEPKTPNEKALHLENGTTVLIPIFAVQRDPEHFPEPNKFDPERFNDENKVNIKPYTYIPFGVGPRNCIGSRFALLETKALLFHILSKFEIVPIEKTEIPLQLNRKSFSMTAENGFWLGLKRREK